MTRAFLFMAVIAYSGVASAQTVLHARDGATEHTLFLIAGVGVYFTRPVGTPLSASTACAVNVRGEGEIALTVYGSIALTEGPLRQCDMAALPHVLLEHDERPNDERRGTLMVLRGHAYIRVPTDRSIGLAITFDSPDAAWRAAASIATGVGQCGFTGNQDNGDTDLICDVGLRINSNRSRASIGLQLDRGVEQRGTCETFADANGFTAGAIDSTNQVCTRGHFLTQYSAQSDLAAALGPCTRWPGHERDLRCGSYRVTIDEERHPTIISRVGR